MDSIFKKYNVYEDVADIISREVHKGNLQEINNKIKRIKIMNYYKNFVEELDVMDYKDSFCEDEDDTITNLTNMLIEDFVYYNLNSNDINDEILLLGTTWMNHHNVKVNYNEKFFSSICGYMYYLGEEENEFMSKVYDNFFNDMNQE